MYIQTTSSGIPLKLKHKYLIPKQKLPHQYRITISGVLEEIIRTIIQRKELPYFKLKEVWVELPRIRERLSIDSKVSCTKIKAKLTSVLVNQLLEVGILTRLDRGYYRYNGSIST